MAQSVSTYWLICKDPLPTYPFGIGKPSILTLRELLLTSPLKREDVFPEELAVASMNSPARCHHGAHSLLIKGRRAMVEENTGELDQLKGGIVTFYSLGFLSHH